jgi:hypothetical protein
VAISASHGRHRTHAAAAPRGAAAAAAARRRAATSTASALDLHACVHRVCRELRDRLK